MSTEPPPIYYGQEPPIKRSNAPWIILAVLGGGACLIIPVMAAILLPVFSQARIAAQKSVCLSNVKQLTLANLMYVDDFDGLLPMAANWSDASQPYIKDLTLKCPLAKSQYSYAYSADLSKKLLKKIDHPDETVMIFEMDATVQNAAGNPKTNCAVPGRHSKLDNYGFLDGHAKSMRPGS